MVRPAARASSFLLDRGPVRYRCHPCEVGWTDPHPGVDPADACCWSCGAPGDPLAPIVRIGLAAGDELDVA